jgi:DNA-binding NtrC family response regulator
MKTFRLLIVDDNRAIHDDIRTVLMPTLSDEERTLQILAAQFTGEPSAPAVAGYEGCSFRIDSAFQGDEAIVMAETAAAENDPYALIFMDERMPPGKDGISTTKEIWRRTSHVEIIIITAYTDYSLEEIHAQLGYSDNLLYLNKPLDCVALKQAVIAMTRKWELDRQNRNHIIELQQDLDTLKENVAVKALKIPDAFKEIITLSPKMHAVFQSIEAIAKSFRPALITGETGVGKGLIAKAIHACSGCSGDFVRFDVGEVDAFHFEDSLFGHIKGAFTGATEQRNGLVKTAAHGTLFLDEIGNLDLDAQKKLLGLIQEKEFRPIGSDKAIPSTARIVAATNVDMLTLLDAQKFRQDMFHRLSAHTIHIPPLRERREDIEPLLEYLIEKSARELKKKKPTSPRELILLLQSYYFPGNVRELENMVDHAVSQHESRMLSMKTFNDHILVREKLLSTQRQAGHPSSSATIVFPDSFPTLKELRAKAIEEAVRRANGSKNVAARLLGITPQALYKILSNRDEEV